MQGPGKSDYTDLMSLVQAQQSRLQSQQAEIKHVSRDSLELSTKLCEFFTMWVHFNNEQALGLLIL